MDFMIKPLLSSKRGVNGVDCHTGTVSMTSPRTEYSHLHQLVRPFCPCSSYYPTFAPWRSSTSFLPPIPSSSKVSAYPPNGAVQHHHVLQLNTSPRSFPLAQPRQQSRFPRISPQRAAPSWLPVHQEHRHRRRIGSGCHCPRQSFLPSTGRKEARDSDEECAEFSRYNWPSSIPHWHRSLLVPDLLLSRLGYNKLGNEITRHAVDW